MATGDDLKDLKTVLREFIADLRDHILTFPDEKCDLFLVELYFEKLSAEHVMHHMIKQILPLERMIRERDEDFFLHHNVLFQGLPDARCVHYRTLWVSNRLSSDDKEAMWTYFDTILEIIRGYKKVN